jgi:hypothetical protein
MGLADLPEVCPFFQICAVDIVAIFSFAASGLSPYFELMAPRGEEVRTGRLPSSELLAASLGSRPTDCAWAWSIR